MGHLDSIRKAVCTKPRVFDRTMHVPRSDAEVTKAIWVYIKKNKLNAGRIIKPDATLKKVLPVASSPHILCRNAFIPSMSSRSRRAALAISRSDLVAFDGWIQNGRAQFVMP